MTKKLFITHHFCYQVDKSLLSTPIATDMLKVEATKVELCEGIAPVITISFKNINVLDIININNWMLVKQECENIAAKHFGTTTNVIVPVNPHYNMPTE